MNVLSGVTDLVAVSPVSVEAKNSAMKPGMFDSVLSDTQIIYAIVLVALWILLHATLACLQCCGNRLDARRRQRLDMRAISLHVRRYTNPHTLRELALLRVLLLMKRPVKHNIGTLRLPIELKRELVHLRRFPLSVASEHSRWV